ncbi:MAG: hypothetical protein IID45_15980 [Planctomycetes bacterium]|nr:hypothetical protein [Planctomycetota bacterium]
MYPTILPLVFLPPLLYRLSLKSTAVLYLPLLWIVLSTFRAISGVEAALTRIRHTDVSRIITAYSVLFLLTMSFKIVCMIGWRNFTEWLESSDLGQLASIYVQPIEVPWWQVSATVNSFVALGLFWYSGEILFRIEHEEPWSETFVENVLRSTTFVRCALTLYTISCTLYITIRAASAWELPRLGTKLFPWW